MRGIVIFYCALLSVTGMSEAAVCRSTEECSDDTICVVNCSDVAVNTFNKPASHGNCRISITSEGEKVQGCYIHECNTSHPGLCVPETALDGDAVSCCCTEDECNSNFEFPPTSAGDTDCVLCVYMCMLILFQMLRLLHLLHLDRVIGRTFIRRTLLMLDQVM